MRGTVAFVGAIALAALGGLPVAGRAADPPAPDRGKEFSGLIAALKESPGCLGVETAETTSGKLVIFAWFEDKKAALAWYNSDAHQQAMKLIRPDAKPRRMPLAGVPDDSGSIMAIASVTPNDKPAKDQPPFKQIAIELYQPLPGGLAFGGRFAPEKLKVPPRKNPDEPEQRSAELQVLDRFVGTWDIKMTVKVPGQAAVNRDISETRKLSRGGAVLVFENPDPPEFHMTWSYDPKAKRYTGVWMFGGDRGFLTGTWDERTSTMKFEGVGADGSTSVSTFRFIDKDHSESSAVYRDRGGKVVSEVTWKHTRRGK